MAFVIIIFIVFGILFGGHYLFYRTLLSFFGIKNPTHILALRIILGILSFSFIIMSLISSRYFNIFTRVLYSLAAGWIGFLLYLVLACVFIWIIYGIFNLIGISFNTKMLAIIMLSLGLATGIYGVINAMIIRVTKITIEMPNLPEEWKNKKAVWVSDTHLGQVRNVPFSEHVASLIQEQHPDIIFIGGDLYDGTAVNLDEAIKPFLELSAPLGKYFITGNHEEFSSSTKYLEAVKKVGIKVLNNEMAVADGMQIIGVDYQTTRSEDNLRAVLEKINPDRSKPSILLRHSPSTFEPTLNAGINLQISGHAHAGQVFPANLISSIIYKGYIYGLKNYGNLKIFISSGAGTWGPPLRVGNYPEIVVFTFK
jgi:predicted MPP superfamily phosphohydrolase